MDPNEALRLIRAHIKQLRVEDKTREDGWIGRLTQQARDLSEAFEALDEWLSRDGFLPADWQSDDDKALVAAIDRIVEAWNGGDLAGAVNAAREVAHPEEIR